MFLLVDAFTQNGGIQREKERKRLGEGKGSAGANQGVREAHVMSSLTAVFAQKWRRRTGERERVREGEWRYFYHFTVALREG